MKRTKLFLTVFMLLCGMNAVMAQDSYREAFKSYLTSNPSAASISVEQMRPVYQQINQTVLKNYDSEESEILISNYINQRFQDDIIDKLMIPSTKKFVSEADLRELTTLCSTPEGKAFLQAGEKMNQIANSPEFQQTMSRAGQAIGLGQTPQTVKLNSGISPAYASLCGEYYDISGMNQLIDQMLAGFSQMASSEQEKQLYAKLGIYMQNNFKNIFINYAQNILQEEQLRFGIKIYSTQAQKNMMKALGDLMSNLQQKSMSLIEGYGEWLDEQGGGS